MRRTTTSLCWGGDMLAVASDVLPVVARGGLVLCGDLYTALEKATRLLEPARGRGDQLAAADQARDLLVEYLIAVGLVAPQASIKQTLRTWMVTAANHDPAVVAAALAAASRYWRTAPDASGTAAAMATEVRDG